MKELIELWVKNFSEQDGVIKIPRPVVVMGERIASLGPRFEFARVWLRFEPSDQFLYSSDVIPRDKDEREFLDFAFLGALDVLATYRKSPVFGVNIIIEGIEIDEINSNARAYRLAARDATQKALEEVGLLRDVLLKTIPHGGMRKVGKTEDPHFLVDQ